MYERCTDTYVSVLIDLTGFWIIHVIDTNIKYMYTFYAQIDDNFYEPALSPADVPIFILGFCQLSLLTFATFRLWARCCV